MSGGTMNYLYGQVQEAKFGLDTPMRRAFATHLKKVAQALHDIEWVDSGDSAPGSEAAAIQECLAPGAELEQLMSEAKTAVSALNDEVSKLEKAAERSMFGPQS